MYRSPDVTDIDLPAELKAEIDALPTANVSRSRTFSEKEDKCIRYAYAVGTHQEALAKWLGISKTTLRKRAKELGLKK